MSAAVASGGNSFRFSLALEKNENSVLCVALTVVVGAAGRGLDAVAVDRGASVVC